RITESGVLEVDRYSLETSRSKFYAGGDLITGASNVSNAMGFGKKAARNIDQRLMGAYRWNQLDAEFQYSNHPPDPPGETARHQLTELPPLERVESFVEVASCLSADEAREEAERCLRC